MVQQRSRAMMKLGLCENERWKTKERKSQQIANGRHGDEWRCEHNHKNGRSAGETFCMSKCYDDECWSWLTGQSRMRQTRLTPRSSCKWRALRRGQRRRWLRRGKRVQAILWEGTAEWAYSENNQPQVQFDHSWDVQKRRKVSCVLKSVELDRANPNLWYKSISQMIILIDYTILPARSEIKQDDLSNPYTLPL